MTLTGKPSNAAPTSWATSSNGSYLPGGKIALPESPRTSTRQPEATLQPRAPTLFKPARALLSPCLHNTSSARSLPSPGPASARPAASPWGPGRQGTTLPTLPLGHLRVGWDFPGVPVGENPLCRLPWWSSGWESACWCKGHMFNPWSGRIPRLRASKPAYNYWAHVLPLQRLACLEPVLHKRSLCTATREQPPLTTTRESLVQ